MIKSLLAVHIAAGIAAILLGVVAVAVGKGGRAHLVRSLAAVDEETFLANKKRATTKRRLAIHRPPRDEHALFLGR